MSLVDRYPKLPLILANTFASKVIQIIKKRAIDPTLGNYRTAQRIQALPEPVKKMAEWFMYVLSGVVRGMPKKDHPVAIVLQEALAESLTNIGIKIEDVSSAEQADIIDVTMPLVQPRFILGARTDNQLRDRLESIFGSTQDWKGLFQSAQDSINQMNEGIGHHRTARKSRGWWRFLWFRN